MAWVGGLVLVLFFYGDSSRVLAIFEDIVIVVNNHLLFFLGFYGEAVFLLQGLGTKVRSFSFERLDSWYWKIVGRGLECIGVQRDGLILK